MRCQKLILLLGLVCAGCRTTAPLPPADFAAPGWTVQQGQAVWQPSAGRPELTGDLLLATNVNGDCYLQFSKMPFALVTAQISGGQWHIGFGAATSFWHGTGIPPARFAWLQLPRGLLGSPLGGAWRLARPDPLTWSLINPDTGEKVEGAFSP